MSARSGSDVDRNNLEEALKYVGFKEIHVYDNLTSNKMLSLMTEGWCSSIVIAQRGH